MREKRYIVILSLMTIFIPLCLQAFTIVQTPRSLPDGGVEASFEQKIINTGKLFFVGRYALSSALNERVILSGGFDVIEKSPAGVQSGMGDGKAGLSYYIGNLSESGLYFGLFSEIIFASGPDLVHNTAYANVALGRSEWSLGSAWRLNLGEAAVQSSISYVARQGEYALFGSHLFSSDRIHNDYIRFAIGVNGSWFSPVIPSIECGVSSPLVKDKGVVKDIPVEGGSIRPIDIAAGIRWCFSDSGSFDLHFIEPIVRKKGYIRESASIRMIIQF